MIVSHDAALWTWMGLVCPLAQSLKSMESGTNGRMLMEKGTGEKLKRGDHVHLQTGWI